jgi:hypothetical protein
MNRKQKKMQDLRAAKDKRMKKVAAGLTVVLAVVLAFEVPGMLKGSGGGSSTPPPATTTTAGAPTTGAPTTVTTAPVTTPTGATASAVPVSSTGSTALPNTGAQPKHGKAQLYSFSHFAGKDPFVQQVDATAPSTGGSSGSSAPSSGSSGSTASSGSSATSAPATAASVKIAGGSSGNRTLAATGSARISVNGRIQVVRVGAGFPSGNPLFKLVSVSHGVVRIGIASGSYSSGAQTVSLTPGRTLTLVDTSDNVRYRIRLLSVA